jgi:hypothetical protein
MAELHSLVLHRGAESFKRLARHSGRPLTTTHNRERTVHHGYSRG